MSEYTVYPKSVKPHGCGKAYMLRDRQGQEFFVNCGITYPLDHRTAAMLRREFPWTAPSRVLALRKTLGTEERTGLCVSGVLEAVAGTDAVPMLVQQSARELSCSGRTWEEALDAASVAVYREGYLGPWGACADRLQSAQELEAALAAGYTCLSLDCAPLLGRGEGPTNELRELYQDQTFSFAGRTVGFDRLTLENCCREYGRVVEFAAEVFSCVRKGSADLEISLCEAETPTTPAGHFFLANELCRRGIVIQALSPRLSLPLEPAAPLEKAEALRKELELHQAVARSFGYKLSFRAAEDKPELLSLLGELTGERLHITLCATSWMESVRLAAREDPALFRWVYELSRAALPAACQENPACPDESALPDLDGLEDKALPSLLTRAPVRQLLYFSCGQVLRSPLREKLIPFLRDHGNKLNELVKNQVRFTLDRLSV